MDVASVCLFNQTSKSSEQSFRGALWPQRSIYDLFNNLWSASLWWTAFPQMVNNQSNYEAQRLAKSVRKRRRCQWSLPNTARRDHRLVTVATWITCVFLVSLGHMDTHTHPNISPSSVPATLCGCVWVCVFSLREQNLWGISDRGGCVFLSFARRMERSEV